MQTDWKKLLSRKAIFPWFRKYAHPKGRQYYVTENLKKFIEGKIIDIGSGLGSPLYKSTFGDNYFSADMPGCYQFELFQEKYSKPDIEIDLENMIIPIKPEEYSTVICTDCLEHIENIHEVHDYLFRLKAKYIIVSLPNNWVNFICDFLVGKHITSILGYGLTVQAPKPGSRHKHFFNLEEAADFLTLRVPDDYKISFMDFLFEKGNDSFLGVVLDNFPFISAAKKWEFNAAIHSLGWLQGVVKWVIMRSFAEITHRFVYLISRIIEIVIWGWGSKCRFYNLFCRQIWVVYERKY